MDRQVLNCRSHWRKRNDKKKFGEIKIWTHQPRVVGRHSKRTQIFFEDKTQLSVKELAAKKEKHCAKIKSGSSKKLARLVHDQRIGCIVGASIKILSDKWCKMHVETKLVTEEDKTEERKELAC